MVLAGHVARALNAALVLVDLTTREDRFLRERVAMPACSHVAQSSSAQALCVTHTERATGVSGCAHNIPAQATMVNASTRVISATHPPSDARRTSTASSRKHSRTPAVQQAKRREFSCLFCHQAATAPPRLPCRTPSCCALLCRGRALLMLPVQDAPRSQRPPGPPARLRLCGLCAVQCDVPELCEWLGCFGYNRISGRLLAVCRCFWLVPLFSFAVRLSLCATTRHPQSMPAPSAPMPWLRSRGVLCSAHSVCEGRFVGPRLRSLQVCFRSVLLSVAVQHRAPTTSLHPLYTQHTHTHRLHLHATHTTRRAPHTHHTYHTLTIHDTTPPTPRTLHTHHIHTTPHLLTTHNHPHHSHHYTRSCSRKLEMAFSLGCAS